MFWLGEYANILLMCAMGSILFLGGWLPPIDVFPFNVIPLFPMFVIFFISALAETNRPPFDLPEAEAELVAGYQTEYSGMMYAMFWLGEYANILLMCAMGAILFLGGWMSPIDVYPFTLVPGAIWSVSYTHLTLPTILLV